MDVEKLKLAELAVLEGVEAERAWAAVRLGHSGRIKAYFSSLKGPFTVPPVKGLEETISWARRKIHSTIENAQKKKKKIPSLSDYLLDNASLVHDLKLVDEFKNSKQLSDEAWKGMVEKFWVEIEKYIKHQSYRKGIIARGCQEPGDFLYVTLKRAKTNLLRGKFNPEKGTLKTHFFNMAKNALKGIEYPIEDIDINIDIDKVPAGRSNKRGIPPEILRQELLALVLAFGGKPHQIIAFGFTQLLDVDAADFVREHSDRILHRLGADFCHDYYELRLPSLAYIKNRKGPCDHLFDELEKSVDIVYELKGAADKGDGENRRTYPKLRPLADKKVGAVCMSAFYGRNPRNDVYDWCYDVKASVKEQYGINKKSEAGNRLH
jgi:hypothetical protein